MSRNNPNTTAEARLFIRQGFEKIHFKVSSNFGVMMMTNIQKLDFHKLS